MLIDAADEGWIPSQLQIFFKPKPAPITLADRGTIKFFYQKNSLGLKSTLWNPKS